MTTLELNRDIKSYENRPSGNTSNWNDYEKNQDVLKLEFKRLYYADNNFDSLNKQSLLIMMTLNNSLRVIPFHVFGQVTIKSI